ncbi:MAG: DUF934 domain-containing protein [Alphaproteobacteria bacterium]|nr:DUF934 domain-containing protein [Alphaproteobacteria bacterium]NNF25192.1 DUF934 domain-containing protein [Paracoccaceae bacterium]
MNARSVLVTDTGFREDDWAHDLTPLKELAANDGSPALGVVLEPDADPAALRRRLDAIDLIVVKFPSFSDGRGFTIAQRLRLMGYPGRLRARGHLIADQYAMARRSGFDEVEISADLAARQPQQQWRARANWQAHSYQNRLRG